jgi:hypothetical protein
MALREGGLTRGARVSIGVNVVLICGLGVAAVVLVLALVQSLSYRFDLRADLTHDGRYTPSPAAEAVLRALDRDVEIRFAFGRDEDIQRRTLDLAGKPREDLYHAHYRPLVADAADRVRRVLEEWTNVSSRLAVEIVDADRAPQRLYEWAVERGKKPGELVNRVFLRRGEEERSVPLTRFVGVDWGYFPPDPRGVPAPPQFDGKWRVQAELAEALRGLAAGEAIPLWLPRGKRAMVEAEDDESSSIRAFLKTQGFAPQPWNAAAGPPKGGVLLLAAPGAGLDAEDVAAVKAYEAAGGRILAIADPRLPEDFGPLLEPYGLKLVSGAVEDPVHGAVADPRLLHSSGLYSGAHEIVRGLTRRAVLALGRARPILDEGVRAPGTVREPILRASAEARYLPVTFAPGTGAPEQTVGDKRDARDAFLGLACERPVDGGAQARLVVLGGSGPVDKNFVAASTALANRDFLLNCLNWLAERKTSAGALEVDRPGSRVELNPAIDRIFTWFGLGILPGGFLLAALVVHLRRRN